MIKTAGVTFDFYDDRGAFLKLKLAGRAVPEAVAEARVLDDGELAALPDNAFAAVIRNGEETLRKFACIDAGNTAVSALYFLENGSKLPLTTRIKIASNLVDACRYFNLVPPTALMKEAVGKVLIKGDGAEVVAARERQASLKKSADLTGTDLMPISAKGATRVKTAAVIADPYVDTTTLEPHAPAAAAELSDDNYAMVSRDGTRSFPLVSWDQVKMASEFFSDQGCRLHPRTRREFCVKVAARANELGIDTDPMLQKYGSATFAPDSDLRVAVETRRQLWRDRHDEEISLLDELMSKRAGLKPDVFAEVLAKLDTLTGSDVYWDKAIMDPWASTYGVTKTAEWRWVNGADVLTEEQLRRFATSSKQFLREHFNDDLANGLEKNPVQVFESLPLPQKQVIARLAAQQEDGGAAAIMSLG